MRGGTQKQGYTIVEVMIFLAISGFMFIVAAGFITGKQANAEFKQGMNSMNTQVRQVINDVGNGLYPANGTLPCSANTTGGPPSFTGPAASAAEQGGNQSCVFLGKVIQFSVGTNPSAYNIFSMAGRQNIGDANSAAPSTFLQAQPRPMVNPTIDFTEHKTTDWGIRVTNMFNGSPANAIGAVGFFGSFNQSTKGSSQTVTAVAVPGSARGQTTTAFTNVLTASTEPALFDAALASNPNPNITICFEGGSARFGSLNIGGVSGQRLSTSIRIGDSAARVGC